MARRFQQILGMNVDSGTYETSTQTIKTWAKNRESRYVCVANVHMTMETVDSEEFKNVVNSADLVTSDGMPLVWMLRKLGHSHSERVYGPELVLRVCAMAEKEQFKIGLYGGTEESLASFRQFLGHQFPSLQVGYAWAPPFRPLSDEEDQRFVREIKEAGIHILFVGIGCPKQERWMYAHRSSIQAVQLGVGAAFDFHSGRIKQAPSWMGKSGLEWLFRLTMEPKRLWRRYAVHNPRFMVRAFWQLVHKQRSSLATFFALVLLLPMILGLSSPHPQGPTQLASSPSTYWVSQHHPDASDYNIGSREQPFLTITGALYNNDLAPGDTIYVETGIYREELRPQKGGTGPESRIAIAGVEGHDVTVSGADLYGTPDRLDDTKWVVNNYFPLGFYGTGTTYERELMIADGIVLRPVFNIADLTDQTFFVERHSASKATIYLNTGSSTPPQLEIAKRGSLFKPGNAYTGCDDLSAPGWYHLKNIRFIHAANQAQSGAICLGSEGSIVENVRADWNNGVGVVVYGQNHEIRNSTANHNGQAGINGTCDGCLLSGNETSFNNWVGHDPFWESGGGKWIASKNLTIRYHTSLSNNGPGIWLDGNNYGVRIEYSKFDHNAIAGVFVELQSENVLVEHTSISNTNRIGWAGAGVLIQAAGGVTVQSSHIFNNDGAGIWIRSDSRYEGGYNRFVLNHLESNGMDPGPDFADYQIESLDPIHLCSNQIVQLERSDQVESFDFEIAEPYERIKGQDVSNYLCLVKY